MKKAIIGIIVIIVSMLIVFAISNLLAYWYECGKPMCTWDESTRNCVVWFTVTTGLIAGAINTKRVLDEIL